MEGEWGFPQLSILGGRFAWCLGAVGDIWLGSGNRPLPVACTPSHTASTEPSPTHSIPVLLKMYTNTLAPHSCSGSFAERVKCAVAERVYIFKMGFVQRSCFYLCAAVFSFFHSHGGKAVDRQGRGGRNSRICC